MKKGFRHKLQWIGADQDGWEDLQLAVEGTGESPYDPSVWLKGGAEVIGNVHEGLLCR